MLVFGTFFIQFPHPRFVRTSWHLFQLEKMHELLLSNLSLLSAMRKYPKIDRTQTEQTKLHTNTLDVFIVSNKLLMVSQTFVCDFYVGVERSEGN